MTPICGCPCGHQKRQQERASKVFGIRLISLRCTYNEPICKLSPLECLSANESQDCAGWYSIHLGKAACDDCGRHLDGNIEYAAVWFFYVAVQLDAKCLVNSYDSNT